MARILKNIDYLQPIKQHGGKRSGAGRKRILGNYISFDAACKAISDARGMETLVADASHVAIRTVKEWRKQYPEIEQASRDAEDRQLDIDELQLFKLIHAGNLGAIIWHLKTKGQRRGYIETSKQWYPGVDSKTIEIDMRAAVIAKIEKLAGSMVHQSIKARSDFTRPLGGMRIDQCTRSISIPPIGCLANTR